MNEQKQLRLARLILSYCEEGRNVQTGDKAYKIEDVMELTEAIEKFYQDERQREKAG